MLRGEGLDGVATHVITSRLERSENPLPPKMHSVVKVRNNLECQQRLKGVCLKPRSPFYLPFMQDTTNLMTSFSVCWMNATISFCSFQEAGETVV